MRLTFQIWRQPKTGAPGKMERYESSNMNPDMSMLEALDVLNEELIAKGTDPVVFEHDCREGICGSCGFMINGIDGAWTDDTTRRQWRAEWTAEFDRLRATLLPVSPSSTLA